MSHGQRPKKKTQTRKKSKLQTKKQPKTQRAKPESRNLKISAKQKPQKPKNSQTDHTQNFHGKKTLNG